MESRNGRMRNGVPGREPGALTRVIGLGGAGWHMVRALSERGDEGLLLAEVNTDLRAAAAIEGVGRFPIGARLTRGLGAGGDPSVGEAAARESVEAIDAALGDCPVVVLLMGLGGGTATGAAPLIAERARDRGAKVAALCALPFGFEGPRRRAQAESGLEALREACDMAFAFENDRLLAALPEDAGVEATFGLCAEMFANLAVALHRALGGRGLIDLDPADLARVLSAGRCGVSWADETGPHRLTAALDRVFDGLLLRDVAEAGLPEVVVHVAGGPELSLADVQRITKRLRQEFGEDIAVSLGAAVEPAWSDRLRVLVIGGGSCPIKAVAPAAVPVQEPRAAPLVPRKVSGRTGGPRPKRDAAPPPPPPPPPLLFEPAVLEEVASELVTCHATDVEEAEPECVVRRGEEAARGLAEAEEEEHAGEEERMFEGGGQDGFREGPMSMPFIRVENEAEEEEGLRFDCDGAGQGWQQASFNFDTPSRGRFDKTEATMYKGENLDIPTFLRRRMRVTAVE